MIPLNARIFRPSASPIRTYNCRIRYIMLNDPTTLHITPSIPQRAPHILLELILDVIISYSTTPCEIQRIAYSHPRNTSYSVLSSSNFWRFRVRICQICSIFRYVNDADQAIISNPVKVSETASVRMLPVGMMSPKPNDV